MFQNEKRDERGWDVDIAESEKGAPFFKNTIVRVLLSANVLFLSASFSVLGYFIRPSENLFILHYNVYFGVEIQGIWWQAFILPLTGVLFFGGHLFFASRLYRKTERIASYLILMFLLTPLFRRAVWRSERRHGYKKTLSRLGGVAMLSAFIFAVFFDPHLVLTREFYGLLFGGVLIFIFGLWDDLSELGWKIQVFFQVALTALIFIFGMRITSLTNPFGGVWIFPYSDFVIPGFGILFVWFFLVMNAMNWLDGGDGLCGGVALITLVTIFFLSLK